MRATVLTAIYGSYDELKPALPQEDVDVDFVCISDVPQPEDLGWRIVVKPSEAHPNRAAKRPKMCPWRYTWIDRSVWIDASYRITSPTFVSEALAFAQPIAQFAHPWRDCVYDEAEESLLLPKYELERERIQWQTAAYRVWQHPERWGLWATGVIAREHTTLVKQLGVQWLRECDTWSYQDQLSEPPILRMLDLRPVEFPGTHLANDWLAYEGSGRH